MKPAQENDVEEAIQLLLSRTYKANGITDALDEDSSETRLETEIGAMKSARTALERSLSLKIASKSRQRNALLAIHRLPVETLVEVFALIALNGEEAFKELLPLRRVSAFWRDVVDNAPQLWGRIDSQAPPDVIQMAIRNSRAYPLDITHYNPVINALEPPKKHPRGSLGDLVPHMHRWRQAVVEVSSQAQLAAIRNPAPMLERLDLQFSGISAALNVMKPVKLFDENAPRLNDVSIQAVPVLWSSEIFSALTEIVLSDLRYPPTTIQLRTILQRCPGLEAFAIYVESPGTIADANDAEKSNIHLAQLNTLGLTLPHGQLCHLLAVIQAPQCNTLSISTISPDPSVETISQLLDLTAPYLASYSATWIEPQLGIRFSDSSLQFNFQGIAPALRWLTIELGEVSPIDPLEWFIEGRESITKGKIFPSILLQTDEDVGPITAMLERLPGVVELRIQALDNLSPNAGPQSMIKWLREPRPTSDGSVQWPFKEVSQLHLLSGPFNGRALLRMLQRRYGVLPLPRENEMHRPLPVPLESLTIFGIEYVDQEDRDGIDALVQGGGGVVVWHSDSADGE